MGGKWCAVRCVKILEVLLSLWGKKEKKRLKLDRMLNIYKEQIFFKRARTRLLIGKNLAKYFCFP